MAYLRFGSKHSVLLYELFEWSLCLTWEEFEEICEKGNYICTDLSRLIRRDGNKLMFYGIPNEEGICKVETLAIEFDRLENFIRKCRAGAVPADSGDLYHFEVKSFKPRPVEFPSVSLLGLCKRDDLLAKCLLHFHKHLTASNWKQMTARIRMYASDGFSIRGSRYLDEINLYGHYTGAFILRENGQYSVHT